MTIRPVGGSCSTRTERQTDMTKLSVVCRCSAKAPKKHGLVPVGKNTFSSTQKKCAGRSVPRGSVAEAQS